MPRSDVHPERDLFGGTGIVPAVETEDNEIFRSDREGIPVSAARILPNGQATSGAARVRSKRGLAAQTLDWTGCGSLLRRLPTWRGVLILNYHRIGYPLRSDFDRNVWSATPEDFAAQLATLKRHFDVIGPDDLDRALNARNARAVMITFDDGYRDNFTHAYPALRHHGLTATFFLTTGFLDQHQVPWWDEIAWMVRNSTLSIVPGGEWFSGPLLLEEPHADAAINRLLRTYKDLDGAETSNYLDWLADTLGTGRCPDDLGRHLWMSWDMVREMRDHGMTFGGHSVTHPVLASISPDEQDYEVGECRRRLIAELDESIDTFSYPVGGKHSYTQTTIEAVARHGYRWGFTYLGGYLQPGRYERYALRRTAIETDVDLPIFRAIATLPQLFA